MKQFELLQKGINLRRKGFSFKEISERLNISKSTASLWLRDTKLTDVGRVRLKNIINQARNRGASTNKKKRIIRQKKLASETLIFKKNLIDYSMDQYKLILAMLYWGEGAKTGHRMNFINSDPAMIKSYLFLLRKVFDIDENKLRVNLHLHEYHNKEDMINFWSKISLINKKNFYVYIKSNTGASEKDGYKGCISLRYGDVNIFDELILIVDRFQSAIK